MPEDYPASAGPVTCIYGLTDPRTDRIRYVGKADCPESRLGQHIADVLQGRCAYNPHKSNWVMQLHREGLQPGIRVLEVVRVDGWQEAEVRWIAALQEQGESLCNLTTGGEGGAFAAEVRQKMAASQQGRKHPEAVKAKIAEAHRGKKHSPEHVEKMRATKKGRPPHPNCHGPEARAKLSAALSGRKRSPEHRAALILGAAKRREREGFTEPLRVSLQCALCGVEFDRASHVVRHVGASLVFCSSEHHHEYERQQREARARECAPAGAEINGGKFLATCGWCGVKIWRFISAIRKSKSGQFFCCREHRNAWRWLDYDPLESAPLA